MKAEKPFSSAELVQKVIPYRFLLLNQKKYCLLGNGEHATIWGCSCLGQLGLRMYSKSTAVEVSSHRSQWEFCHYQELEKRILRHISLLSTLWIFTGTAKSFKKGFHLQRMKRKEKRWHLMCVKAWVILFLQLKQPANTYNAQEINPGVVKTPPPSPCTAALHFAQTLLLKATWSFKACFLRGTWAMPILVN